jgi:guanosine-3',5'-bis(diphosphate) 3'-pyrophosphohydrolase
MYSEGIEQAIRAAFDAHDGQLRKGAGEIPYVTHPIHAGLILARMGADVETIQAAILHDVVEDSDDWTDERVVREFGTRVAEIVADLTEDKSGTWKERKQAAIEHVPHMSLAAALVKAADKLHNLESLLAELRSADEPTAVWSKFKGGRTRTLEYSADLIEALAKRIDESLARSLAAVLAALQDQP